MPSCCVKSTAVLGGMPNETGIVDGRKDPTFFDRRVSTPTMSIGVETSGI